MNEQEPKVQIEKTGAVTPVCAMNILSFGGSRSHAMKRIVVHSIAIKTLIALVMAILQTVSFLDTRISMTFSVSRVWIEVHNLYLHLVSPTIHSHE